jgi:hypothetical protein
MSGGNSAHFVLGKAKSPMSDDPSDGTDGGKVVPLRGTVQGPEADRPDAGLWFLNPEYQPCPEYDIVIGDYRFRYRPEYEEYYIGRGLKGQSLVAISVELGIPFAVIRQWARKIQSFAVALDISRQNCQAYWENIGHSGITRKSFNASGWLRMMSIRFPESWREIEPSAKVTAPDPYRFNEQGDEDDEEALVNTEIILERLVRIKESG